MLFDSPVKLGHFQQMNAHTLLARKHTATTMRYWPEVKKDAFTLVCGCAHCLHDTCSRLRARLFRSQCVVWSYSPHADSCRSSVRMPVVELELLTHELLQPHRQENGDAYNEFEEGKRREKSAFSHCRKHFLDRGKGSENVE